MNDLSTVIGDVASGVGRTASNLREAGIDVDLVGYTVEVSLDPTDDAPAATVSVTLAGVPRHHGSNGSSDDRRREIASQQPRVRSPGPG